MSQEESQEEPADDNGSKAPQQTPQKPTSESRKLPSAVEPHSRIEREFDLKLFILHHRESFKVAAFVIFVLLALVVIVANFKTIQKFFGGSEVRDSDRDGVPDTIDICPGHDDRVDQNSNGIPDGCDERPPANFTVDVVNTYLFAKDGKTDALVEIANNFSDWGYREFEYTISLRDASDNLLLEKKGQSYILPSEKKYILELGLESKGAVSKVNFEITDRKWAKLENLQSLVLETKNLKFSAPSLSSQQKSVASGSLVNKTPYSFEEVEVFITARDATSRIIGATRTTLNVLSTGTQRDFRVLWDFPDYAHVDHIDVTPKINIYQSDNFIQEFRKGGGRYLEYIEE